MSGSPVATPQLPAQPFFTSTEQRVALARDRFFERGERPTGLVSETVLQSWSRCVGARRNPARAVEFDPISRPRIQAVLERNRDLLRAAHEPVTQLERALAGSGCRVLLTDAGGVQVRAPGEVPGHGEPVLRSAARIGVSLDERHVGTNAPGLVLRTGAATVVTGAEHFFANTGVLSCVAAPIGDGRGGLAGVLDLTVEGRPFAFDAAALVGLHAAMIENELMLARARDTVVVRFQVGPGLLQGPMQALAGIDGEGRLAWCNGAARRLLGLAAEAGDDVERLFGLTLAALLHRRGAPTAPLPLPNGLTIWAQVALAGAGAQAGSGWGHRVAVSHAGGSVVAGRDAGLQAGTGADGAGGSRVPSGTDDDAGSNGGMPAPRVATWAGPTAPTPGLPAPTLEQHTRETIRRVVDECSGNLSAAARRLGVSRGLLYRRLRG